MAPLIYLLCAATSLLCFALLLRSYHAKRYKLLLYSALCFAGLSVNNVLLVVDRIVFPTSVDLSALRLVTALIALLPLLYGLVWEEN